VQKELLKSYSKIVVPSSVAETLPKPLVQIYSMARVL